METFGNQLKEAIKEIGLTQEEAANRLGITRQTIGQWFKRAVFDANTLHDVKSKLGVDLEKSKDQKKPDVKVPREVFEKMSRLIDTVCSQQDTISEQHRTIDRLILGKQIESDAPMGGRVASADAK